MAIGTGSFELQNATRYSAMLGQQFQASSRLLSVVKTENIGDNATYTGQILQKVYSHIVGAMARPTFQTGTITAYQATLEAFECPIHVSDVSISNVQFGASVLGKSSEAIGMEMGRRADKVFISALNQQYDVSTTMNVGGYFDVQAFTEARNIMGQNAVRGKLILLTEYECFSNLLLDQRFSNFFFNNNKPLALNYPMPSEDIYYDYASVMFVKLSKDTPLPTANAGADLRMFMFSYDSVLMLLGNVNPYGQFGIQTQFQVHRGGWDINTRMRMAAVIEQKLGVMAIESTAGYMPKIAA